MARKTIQPNIRGVSFSTGIAPVTEERIDALVEALSTDLTRPSRGQVVDLAILSLHNQQTRNQDETSNKEDSAS